MSTDDPNVDRLNDALDALLKGAAPDEACAGLPAAFRPLAEAAARLTALRAAGDPSPAFVLGLEDRLRADLRRAPAPPSDDADPPPAAPAAPIGAPRRRILAWGLVLAAALGLGAAIERAAPRDDLYPVKRSLESARALLSVTAAGRAEAYLELGWRRLREIEDLMAAPAADAARLDGLLDDLATAYRLALAYAHQSGDDRVVFLAQSEARLAFDQIQRWAAVADARRARALRQVELVVRHPAPVGREILAVTWSPAAPEQPPARHGAAGGPGAVAALVPLGVTAMAPPVVATPAAPEPTPPAAPSPAPPTPAASPAVPPTAPPTAPTVTAAPTAAPPVPSPTVAPPPTAVPPPSPEPTARPGRPRPRPPTATAAPPPLPSPTEEPWLTATAAPPRHTPDPWAVSPTPPPASPTPDVPPTPDAAPGPQGPAAPGDPPPGAASPPAPRAP